MRWSFLIVVLGACKAPPEAPADLDGAAVYVYEEQQNDDVDVWALGVENLRAWFETGFEADGDEGFELTVGLSQEAVDLLDGSAAFTHEDTVEARLVEGIRGAAVASAGAYGIDAYADAMTATPQNEVYPDLFEDWDATETLCTGAEFATRDCLDFEFVEFQSSAFGLGLRSEGEAYNQYRWVQLADGQWSFTQRNWQIYPPEVSNNLLEVSDQFYLNVFIPSTDGSNVWHFQATWAVFGDRVPEDIGLNLTEGSMSDNHEQLEDYLAEQ